MEGPDLEMLILAIRSHGIFRGPHRCPLKASLAKPPWVHGSSSPENAASTGATTPWARQLHQSCQQGRAQAYLVAACPFLPPVGFPNAGVRCFCSHFSPLFIFPRLFRALLHRTCDENMPSSLLPIHWFTQVTYRT